SVRVLVELGRRRERDPVARRDGDPHVRAAPPAPLAQDRGAAGRERVGLPAADPDRGNPAGRADLGAGRVRYGSRPGRRRAARRALRMTRDDLLLYYERELRFIRKLATGFAEKYPEVAGRLLLEPTKCEDPHVERLIEAFAMLTARI